MRYALLAFALLTSPAAADTFYWAQVNPSWYTLADWSTWQGPATRYPAMSDTALFFGSKPASYYATGATLSVGTLQIQGSSPLLITSYALLTNNVNDYASANVQFVTDLSGSVTKQGSGELLLSGRDTFGSITDVSGTIYVTQPFTCSRLTIGGAGTFLYDPKATIKQSLTPVSEPDTLLLLAVALACIFAPAPRLS